jgi:hypothetical protein
MRKFLFIGLGGSGGKTLRFLRADLLEWLDRIGWQSSVPGSLPVGWQLLQIDTPSVQDGMEIKDVPALPNENYVGLVGPGINFKNVSSTLTGRARSSEGWKDQTTWRVNPTFLSVPIAMGAGQYRAVGRTIGLAYADRIHEAIRKAEKRLMSSDANAELMQISELIGEQPGNNSDPVAVVVSSLAGGSGAGILMDTCDLLRQVGGSWGDNSFGILYGSDVFTQLGSTVGGIQPNTLAAVSEVLNGHWYSPTSDSPSGRINPLLSAAGAAIPVTRSGPAYPFLVGASNTKGVSFGDQKSVYQMMGRALRSWTVDSTVQDELIAYTITNWNDAAKKNVVNADVLLQHHEPVFEAYGFAEVNLGVDRFQRYASERLARMAADWLHNGHMDRAFKIDPTMSKTPDVVIDELAGTLLPGFMKKSGLNERGPDNNDVIDAIKPSEQDAWFHEKESQLFGAAIEGVPSNGINRDKWVAQINTYLPGYADELVQVGVEAMYLRAQQWVTDQPQKVLEAATWVISEGGLKVAKAVIDLAIETSMATVDELLSEAADEFDPFASSYIDAMHAELNSAGRIKPEHDFVRLAVSQGLWSKAVFSLEATRRRLGAELLRELAKNVLRPLQRVLTEAYQSLDLKGYLGELAIEPQVINWAADAVPSSLKPPKNECLVIPINTFSKQFDSMLISSFEEVGLEDALTKARIAVIDGVFLTDLADTNVTPGMPIEINQKWVIESLPISKGYSAVPAPATFKTAFNPEDLLARAATWLKRPGTTFQRFLSSDLRSYLSESPGVDPRELNERQQSFLSAFKSALDSAEPLVEIDQGLKTLLHPQASSKPKARPGNIPLKEHALEAQVKSVLAAALGGGTNPVNDGIFTTDQRVTSIPINSTLGAPHDPLVFESISAPIIASWATVANSPASMNFWLNRRARPISEFVPVSQQLLGTMTRGWFTALMLGRLDREKLQIRRSNGSVAEFPQVLLTNVDRFGRDLMPAVFESLGLAYIQLAQHTSTESLDAYSELRDLGVEASGGRNYREYDQYKKVNSAVENWLKTGDFAIEPLAKPLLQDSTSSSDFTREDRRNFAVKLLKTTRESYEKQYATYEEKVKDEADELGPEYGLWPGMFGHIRRSLELLEKALDGSPKDEDIVM